MQQKKYSLETILSNFDIDALNEMQQASIEANKKQGDIILLADRLGKNTRFFTTHI